MSPQQKDIQALWLKVTKIQMKKRIEKGNKLLTKMGRKGILEIMTVKASKGYKKIEDRTIKNDKYAQMKMFHHDRQLQVYMYDFKYVDLPYKLDRLFQNTKLMLILKN